MKGFPLSPSNIGSKHKINCFFLAKIHQTRQHILKRKGKGASLISCTRLTPADMRVQLSPNMWTCSLLTHYNFRGNIKEGCLRAENTIFSTVIFSSAGYPLISWVDRDICCVRFMPIEPRPLWLGFEPILLGWAPISWPLFSVDLRISILNTSIDRDSIQETLQITSLAPESGRLAPSNSFLAGKFLNYWILINICSYTLASRAGHTCTLTYSIHIYLYKFMRVFIYDAQRTGLN